ncbi:MAG: rRNA maturation RNase YbeY [Oscillospiraceae bacterium]|nr:rRNA maturation RNase YbeY [Oscillospiraceae bacterium]
MSKLKLSFSTKIKYGLNFRPLAFRVCHKVLEYENYTNTAEISLMFVSDEEIHGLNRKHRDVDRPTDVLSFPIGEPNHDEGAVTLGDIVISLPTAQAQAKQYGHSTKRELAFLIVHGLLHLLGYDHINEDDEKIMTLKQKEILELLGLPREASKC